MSRMIPSEKITIADSSNQMESNAIPESIIKKQSVAVENGKYLPETLWAMGRIASYAVSPDLLSIAYTVA